MHVQTAMATIASINQTRKQMYTYVKYLFIQGEDYRLRGCDAVHSGGSSPAFRRNVLIPYLELRSKPRKQTIGCCLILAGQHVLPKRRYVSIRLHGVISEMTVWITVITVKNLKSNMINQDFQ
jgi:hypothetical protein